MEKHLVVLIENQGTDIDKEDSKVAVGPCGSLQGQIASKWQKPD